MIMSAFTNLEMSSSIDSLPQEGGQDGRRGHGAHECEGAAATACDSVGHGEEDPAARGGGVARADGAPSAAPDQTRASGGRRRIGPSGPRPALEPGPCAGAEGTGA